MVSFSYPSRRLPATLSPLLAFRGVARDFHSPGQHRLVLSTATVWEKYRQPGFGNIQFLMGHVTPIPVFGRRQYGRIHTFAYSTPFFPCVCLSLASRSSRGREQRPQGKNNHYQKVCKEKKQPSTVNPSLRDRVRSRDPAHHCAIRFRVNFTARLTRQRQSDRHRLGQIS
jgi:hypothetical protein